MKDIIEERNKLLKKSMELRNCHFLIKDYNRSEKIRKEQNETYRKLKFYDKFIEMKEKENEKN